jgi:hypothetical protein
MPIEAIVLLVRAAALVRLGGRVGDVVRTGEHRVRSRHRIS